MHSLINYNGATVPITDVNISPANGGLLHGCGVFTTLRIYYGKPFLFDEHWQRLESNARAIGLDDYWVRGLVRDALTALISANRVVEGKARITLLQNESRYWRSGAGGLKVDLLIFTGAVSGKTMDEVALTISPYRINSTSPLAGVKVISHLQQMLTLKEAEARDFNEALVLNERGEVCETAAANIFWVRGKVLYTPALTTGCLPGTARQLVLKLAREAGIETTEGAFHSEHILSAEEAFLTSSIRELTQASCLNFYQFPGSAHSVFEKLLRAYKHQVYLAAHNSSFS